MFNFLLESPVGYALFEVHEVDEIASSAERVRSTTDDVAGFSRGARLVAFRPFEDEREALDNALQVSEGELTDTLKAFLEANVKIGKKEKDRYLGVEDPKLASAIQAASGIPCRSNDVVTELVRAGRTHLVHLVKGLDEPRVEQASLGLGHAYSRTKVKFNVHRQDNMLIQAIALLDQIDKDINTNSMRVREWYGWHFPELTKTVTDPYLYSRLVTALGDRALTCSADSRDATMEKLVDVTNDPELANKIFDAALSSMGMDVSEVDMLNITSFAKRVEDLAKYRRELHDYLTNKMQLVAPNLNALLGEAVGARLIAHAGSLTKLSKLPASTVQILGAEKALFRALKTKGNTPKFGLLFNSTYISRAGAKNKGRISRYLANKCALASRIDSYSDAPTSVYGESLRDQVEERLEFYESGKTPKKNLEVMEEAKKKLVKESRMEEVAAAASGSKKRRKADEEAEAEEGNGEDEETEEERRARKKAKKAAKMAAAGKA